MGLSRSPDGRVWKLDRIRPKLREAETFKVPFFWSSVVATIVLLVFIFRLVWVDPTSDGVHLSGGPSRERDVKGPPLVRSG